jgi:MSHA pilin protein MshD
VRRVRPALGVSLVELIISIAIIGTGVAGILAVMDLTTRRSADPMAVQQAQLIAEGYLEEILLKKFYDPDTETVCPAPEGSRANYDNVCDYHNLNDNTGARNQFGTVVTDLELYNVTVTVTSAGVTLGSINNTGATRVLRVDVVVTHDRFDNVNVPLTGYRTNYSCNPVSAPENCKS